MKLLLNPTRVVFTENETQNILAEYLSERGFNNPVKIEIERSGVPPVVKPESKKNHLTFEQFQEIYTKYLLEGLLLCDTDQEREESRRNFSRDLGLRANETDRALMMLSNRDVKIAWFIYKKTH